MSKIKISSLIGAAAILLSAMTTSLMAGSLCNDGIMEKKEVKIAKR